MNRIQLAALAVSTLAGWAGLPSSHDATRHLECSDIRATAAVAGEEFGQEQANAHLGDRDAMFRLAQMFRQGSNGAPRDEAMMVSWLRQASELDHKVASYQLYLHYLDRGLDRYAIHYEKLALRQGYVIPPRLDPRRG